MGDNRVKCRPCDWSTSRFRRTKDKTTGPEAAQRRLRNHFELCHPAEYEEISAQTDAEEVK